ncbi:MAG: FAD:protein FMN transferase [Flavobacteriales bacterium]|nr:FAD:protein FMN transferase [Flavobacteriales bacterium]
MNRTAFFCFSFLLLMVACAPRDEMTQLTGKAQGTTFSIKYHGESAPDLSEEVSRVLEEIDLSMNLWREDSFISEINNSGDSLLQIPSKDVHFIPVFKSSYEVFRRTKGAFDPTVYPLVKVWGFGAIPPDADTIPSVESLLAHHHIGEWKMHIAAIGPEIALVKPAETQVDFNGIAQGYSVDALGALLEEEGIQNYMIELGGEVLVKGQKLDGSPWSIGIEKPQEGEREILKKLELHDESIATSGSYRKYQERDGKRFSHCIDPRSGYPVNHSLLSVTVIAPTAMEADAYATAFLVMGVEESLAMLNKGLGESMEVLFIYDENGENRMKGTGRFSDVNAD